MSQGKFAAMTSALLVRKGGAAPSIVVSQRTEEPAPAARTLREITPREPVMPVAMDLPVSAKAIHPKDMRRVVLMLSHEDYERLGIASVKKNITRHQFAQEALFAHLDATAREHGGCHCIAGGEPCGCARPSLT